MAAALRQYQACVGIMVRLQVEDLTALKHDFDSVGDRGLALHEFVSVMLARVSAWDEASVVQFIEDLVELFAQVDVNGDGTMEWEEFTSAIIEGGMGTMGDDLDWRDLQYEENTAFADVLNRPPKRVQYLSEFKRLLVHDNTRPVVEIVDPIPLLPSPSDTNADETATLVTDTTLPATQEPATDQIASSSGSATPVLSILNKFHPLCYITGYRRDQDDVRSERSPVQALKYLSKVDLLAVSGGDLKLTFWASTIVTANSTSALETPLPLAIVHTPRPQRVLEWNPSAQHLYSISADLMITVWHVRRERFHDSKGRCEVSLYTTLKQHTDLLQDLLLLNSELLVSCGMDNMIYLWDTDTLQVRTTRQGHRRGVRLLTKLSNQLFLSAGFECEILGWDISALATAPVFKLWGHNAPVCCIQLIQSAAFASQHGRRNSSVHMGADDNGATNATILGDQAITVDDDGWFKWWNLANITSMENNDLEQNGDRCLQSLRLGSDKYPWKAHSLAALNNGQIVLAAGFHKLKLLQRVRLKPKVLPSSVVLFNSVSSTLLTTTDREIRVWDATSGALLRTFRNIAASDISCVDLDARQRKIVFGTQRGELVVVNYMNGAILKTWTPHQMNVSALIYCKEDQCVLTASWDRSLRLYDDNTSSNSLLRCATEAHDTDIKCMAYCYAMSLVATGSADGVIKVWDYVYFLLEDVCSLSAHSLEQSDVTALEFMEPYPLLVSCHDNGMVCCWNVSPTQASMLLFHYAPFLRDPTVNPLEPIYARLDVQEDDEQKGAVCCCQVFYDESGGEILANDIRKGRFLLVTASLDGEICVDDFSHILKLFNLKAFRLESLPSNHFGSYNPRRRFIRHGASAKRLKNHLKVGGVGGVDVQPDILIDGESEALSRSPIVKTSDVVQVTKWKAHEGAIRFLRTVEEPQAILTCSSDKTVRVWSFTGANLGLLSHIQPSSGTRSDVEDGAVPGWDWTIDTATSTQMKRAQAEEMWESMKVEKLKLLTRRMQSIQLNDRNHRRSSMRLRSSISTPNLSTDVDARDSQQTDQPTPNQSHDASMPIETDRLFKQLKGEATWKQSDFQLARHEAWDKERTKFQQRMKRILKKKAKATAEEGDSNQQAFARDEDASENDAAVAESLQDDFDRDGAVGPAINLLPDSLSSAVQELPFDDKDNWSVGGLNRQKQMYGNFHHESVRRSQKVLSSRGSKLRKMQSMTNIDLAPSSFLLEQLGSTCVIRENVALPSTLRPVRNAKKNSKGRSSLGQSQSMISLSSSKGLSNLSTPSADTAADESRIMPPAVLAQQPTIKELFLQHGAFEDKVQRASRILTRAGPLRQDKRLSPLDNIQEDAISNAPETEKTAKPTSPTRRIKSAGRTSSIGAKARKAPLKSAEASTKKLRIRSDMAVMRQDYFGTYSRDDVVSLYRTFNTIDKDKSGTISLHELVDGAGLFGSTHLRDNAMGIFSSIDKDQSGHIDLEELCRAIFNDAPSEVIHDILHFCSVLESAEKAKQDKKRRKISPEQLKELKELFNLYDSDQNGDIDVDELFTALRYNAKFYDDGSTSSGGKGNEDNKTPNITREDIERIIARFDVNTNASLDLHEFIELFRDD